MTRFTPRVTRTDSSEVPFERADKSVKVESVYCNTQRRTRNVLSVFTIPFRRNEIWEQTKRTAVQRIGKILIFYVKQSILLTRDDVKVTKLVVAEVEVVTTGKDLFVVLEAVALQWLIISWINLIEKRNHQETEIFNGSQTVACTPAKANPECVNKCQQLTNG